MENVLDIEKFNIIEDDENYYFFRALNREDNNDLENGIILEETGKLNRIRTDRERYEENEPTGKAKYNKEDEISLEQVYDHIKMHYRRDTNCISLSSNGNVSIDYGRGNYKDRYVMVKVPKKEFGEKVISAGQYMLEEIEKKVNEYISSLNDSKLTETLSKIDDSKTSEELKAIIETKYTSKSELNQEKARPRKGIKYRSPVARISNYQALNEEQSIEKNKIIAKLTLLEKIYGMPPIIPHTANNNLLIQTIGNAFSSLEIIHYGDIKQEEIIEVQKEIVDIFAIIQQVEGQDKQIIGDLKREVIDFINKGKHIEIPNDSTLLQNYEVKDNISINEMYELTEGKVEYGMANSVVKKMFYIAKSQANAREFSKILNQITENNEKYRGIIEYISANTFAIEPNIITKQSNRGVKISESVSLDLENEEIEVIEKIKELSTEEQIEIIEKGGLSNVKYIMNTTFSKAQRSETISKEEYYAEAIFSLYDWEKIGIEEFTISERKNLIQRIQNEYCAELYKKLEEQGIDKIDIPKIILNIITRKNDFEIIPNDTPKDIKEKRIEQYDRILKNNIEDLKQELSIEKVERFLGYYDVPKTKIQLRPYQQTAVEKSDEIFEENRFASVILPTGAGKSFVTLAELMKHQNEEILYLAPQNEIIEQMKDYIIKYIHGPVNTIGRSKDEIIADVFPKLKFSTYPGLLAKDGKKIINKQYEFIVLDELHRTGAKEWGDRLNTLIDNQTKDTKVLGITATPRRDSDGINMAKEIAEKLGYTNKEAASGKHIAMNMSLINAIRMGLVVNPKLVSCAYGLKTDGSLDRLKENIEEIEDIQEKNEKLEKYESLRRNIENAEGISQILQTNVKKGGKYIVFLPVVDEIEDEDGNVIGRKKGKTKIQDYEKQIAKYFKGSDIKPRFHSMLGEYGDKENSRRLEEFQNSNTEETEFMLVMNKANEGLHLEKLDGIVWLRPIDENSRILYLQQLGRVIYSEDPDNPTKEEDRPVVIDLVNNTIKVNWENEITEQDDIELLNIIINWTETHDGILPDINSTDKEETGYATVLKEIQNKYKGYLEENKFENLNDKQINEIQEILRLGSLIDLWQIELPEKINKNGESKERNFKNKDMGPFELMGVLNDFVELENDVNEINERTAIDKILNKFEKLASIGVDVSKIKVGDTIESLAKKSGIDVKKIEEVGLKLDDKIRIALNNIKQAYRGRGTCAKPTEEQVKEFLKFGINLEKSETNACQKLLDKFEKLASIGVDVSKIKQRDTIESLAKKLGIDVKKIEEVGLKLDDKIGIALSSIKQAYRGNGSYIKPTEEQVKEFLRLGINLEERNVCQELLDKFEKLKSIGVDVSKIQEKDTIKSLVEKSGIDVKKIEEVGLKLDDKIGKALSHIKQAYRGNGTNIKPTEEQIKEFLKYGINVEKSETNACQELLDKFEKMKKIGVDVSKIQQKDTIESLAKKSGIDVKKIEEVGLKLDDKIGIALSRIKQVYRGNVRGIKPTEEQVKKFLEFGISFETKRRTGKQIAQASISSLANVEMIDREGEKLKALVKETKKDKNK